MLDEMDAPLDESNIMRFVKILDRFVGQSQFVVITHNKRTISRADLLYGVTMEEHGVSKLVGVRFTRREDSSNRNDIIGTANLLPGPKRRGKLRQNRRTLQRAKSRVSASATFEVNQIFRKRTDKLAGLFTDPNESNSVLSR